MKACKLEHCLEKPAFCILYFVAAISPFVSLYAGLGLTPLFILAALLPTIIFIRKNIWRDILESNIYKVILVFFVYCLISALWAIAPKETINLLLRMVLLFVGFISLFEFIKTIDSRQKQILCKCLLSGFMVALVAANVEIISDGMVSKFFRSFKAKEYTYALTDLNRGSTYLSILFWPVFAWLILKKKTLFAFVLLALTAFTLFNLESQSSSIAIVLSSLAFVFVSALGKKAVKIMMFVAVFAVFGVATTAYKMNPDKMFEVLPNIPNSASQYRLYIWDFVADRAMQKPVLGWGFNASRSMPITKEDYILNGRHPLPLHPHNNVLQVWLELGIIGLFIFAAFLLFLMKSIKNINYSTALKFDKKDVFLNKISANLPTALVFGLFASYFAIGETCYGIWQNWWVAGGLLSLIFMVSHFATDDNQTVS